MKKIEVCAGNLYRRNEIYDNSPGYVWIRECGYRKMSPLTQKFFRKTDQKANPVTVEYCQKYHIN